MNPGRFDPPPGDGRITRMEFLLTLRQQGIMDAGVLRAMDEVPREHFVTDQHVDSAYADHALPIACGQTISQPYVVAYMTERLQVQPHHRVLEIGTGSGYQAAVLSRLAEQVVSIERFRTLAEAAKVRIETLGFANVQVEIGAGELGFPERAPYDRIIVTAATETIPDALLDQLSDPGILLLPLGPQDGIQRIVKVHKHQGALDQETLIAVRFVPLLPGRARDM
jgi:protein-L-isoaspartate(D-aspartate) O-methyltransferase